MTKRRKKKSAAKTISTEAFAKIAAEAVPQHELLFGQGHVLSPSSRLWRRSDGTWSARFIYVRKDGILTTKFVVTTDLELV